MLAMSIPMKSRRWWVGIVGRRRARRSSRSEVAQVRQAANTNPFCSSFRPSRGSGESRNDESEFTRVGLIRSDVGAADHAPVVLVLLAQKGGEILPTNACREKAELVELGFDLWRLHRCGEPVCELRNERLRRVRRGKQSPPEINLEARIALGDCRHIRQGRYARGRGHR